MGRSNGCEANRKREDAKKRAEKYNKEGNSQVSKNAAAMSLVCSVCMQAFMCTQIKMAQQHAEAKHPKNSFQECFPNAEEATANTAQSKKAKK